jgi:hypothetical protein
MTASFDTVACEGILYSKKRVTVSLGLMLPKEIKSIS